jgi:Galactosyltransferase
MTTRFVIGDPGPLWRPAIEYENSTYGDIIILEGLPENSHTANTIKTMELFKHLTEINSAWSFVSKLDDDSFIDARAFRENYLAPLLKLGHAEQSRSVIGRDVFRHGVHYPGGQFYTVSWDMVNILAGLQTRFNVVDSDEDILVQRLLAAGEEQWNFITMSNPIAFDYEQKDAINETTAWARSETDQDAWEHAVGPMAINPHKMKDDETYLRVAACFDERGLKEFNTR